MFLIRAAFWLSVVILLIPADPETGADAPRVGVFDAMAAASTAVSDISSFCDRNPSTCETGGSAFRVFVAKARYGVRMLTESTGDPDEAEHVEKANTGELDTLTGTDRAI